MAGDRGSKRPTNPRTEFGKRQATYRSFLRQAEALNRHEAKIAAHTAIQSWTNIIAVVMSVVTTTALIVIALLQWNSSERDVALAYALAQPAYKIDFTFADGQRYAESSAAAWADDIDNERLPQPITRLSFSAKDDSVKIDYIEIRQIYFLDNGEETCDFALSNAFQSDNGIDFVDRISGTLTSHATFISEKSRKPVSLRWSRTEVYTRYADVFGESRHDLVVLSGQGSRTARNVDEPPFINEFGLVLSGNTLTIFDRHSALTGPCTKHVFSQIEYRERSGGLVAP